MIGSRIRAAWEMLGLPVSLLADALEMPEAEVQAIQAGADVHAMETVSRTATLLGISGVDLLRGNVEGPAPILYRSPLWQASSIEELLSGQDVRTLGEFLLAAQSLSELELALGQAAPDLISRFKSLSPPDGAWKTPAEQARELAEHVRRELGLGADPIPSMLGLLKEQLGVACFFVSPDEDLNRMIDGASTLWPRPSILVNLIGGPSEWWRTRTTLAHELCHLLFDRRLLGDNQGRFFLVSPDAPRRHARRLLGADLLPVEQRANAFSAYFLAPPQGVRACAEDAGGMKSKETVRLICERFGVSPTLAAMNLMNVGKQLDEPEARRLAAEVESPLRGQDHPDEASVRQGLYAGALADAVQAALRGGRINRIDAHKHLRLPLTAPFPDTWGLPEALRAPVIRPERQALEAATRHLNKNQAAEGLLASRVIPLEDGWQVELATQGADGQLHPAGTLRLSAGFDVLGRDSAT